MRFALSLIATVVALAAAGTAAAATAPSATTGPVSSVAPTSATVTGNVDPNGAATTWYVEYGTTTGYGSKTGSANAGSGTSTVPVSASLTGLKPGTTYHYRVVATSSAGTSNGADGILTTTAAPDAATGAASGVNASSATLTGTVNPNGQSTSWYFEYGSTTSYGSKTASHDAGAGTTSVSVSATITGLTPGKTYHYRLVAASGAGTTDGSDKTFVASEKPTVTTAAANVLGDTSLKANGSVNPNGLATSAWFEYGTSTSYGSKTAAVSMGSGSSAKSISATLSNLAGTTTYHIRLVASNGSGTSYGNDVTVTTTGRPLASTSAATDVAGTSVTLNGSVNPEGHATTWYAEWGLTTAYGTKTGSQSLSGGTNTVNVSTPLGGLLAGTTYHFRIVATNASGTTTSGDLAFTTAGPGVTLAVSSPTALSGHAVRLSGTTITHNANEQVTLWALPFGASSFVQLTTVLTGANGTWAFDVKPRRATSYKAQVTAGPSPVVTVAVRPAVTLRIVHGRVVVAVESSLSYAGQTVLLQRRSGTGWADLGFHRLNGSGSATISLHLRRGHWMLRALVGRRLGVLAGTSNELSLRVR